MVKSIGIFVASSELLLAIENGPPQRSFPNDRSGVDRLFEYLIEHIEPAPDGIFLLIGWLDDQASQAAIIDGLHQFDIKYSLVFPEEIEATDFSERASGLAVIEGFSARRNRIFKRSP